LIQGEFVLKTDHRALTYLDEQRLTTPWQQKALTKLMGLQYKLSYKKGIKSKAANALSRIHPQDNLEILALSVTQSVWLEEVTQGYVRCPDTAKLLASLAVQSPLGEYTLRDRVIRYRGRILVPPDTQMQVKIITTLHASPVGGHSGFQVTYQKVKALFWWARLKDMKDLVTSCQIC
jgi:hypothetical protein